MAVSVYISNDRIHIVTGNGSSKRMKVKQVYQLSLAEGAVMNGIITGEQQLKERLEQIWAQYRLPRKKLRLVIDSGTIMTKVLEVPHMKERELISHIRQEFADGERQEPVVDYFALSGNGAKAMKRIFCGAVDKSVLDSYLSVFRQLKLKVSGIDIGLGCLIRAVGASGIFHNKTCILMMLEGNNAISVLFENGAYIYSRRNRLFSEPGTPEWIEDLNRVADGIRQFHIQRHSSHALDTLYLVCCPEAVIQELDVRMRDYGIRAKEPDYFDRISFPGKGTGDNGSVSVKPYSYLYSIGNLLDLKGAPRQRMDFYERMKKSPERIRKKRRRAVTAAAAVAAAASMALVLMYLRQEKLGLEQEISVLKEYVEDESNAAEASRAQQLENQVKEQGEQLRDFRNAGENIRSYPLVTSEVFETLEKCCPDKVSITITGYSSSSGELQFDAVAPQVTDVSEVIEQWKELSIFKSVYFTGYIQNRGQEGYTVKVVCVLDENAGR